MNQVPLSITIDPHEVLRSALSRLYKNPDFNAAVPVVIHFSGERAVDMGGPRRQFFTMLLKELAASEEVGLFEGNDTQLLPRYNTDAIIAPHFKMMGKITVHSVLQEGPRFPCLAPAVYRYLVTGSVDGALEYLSTDLPLCVGTLVDQVCINYTA